MRRNKRWVLGLGLVGLLAVPLAAQSVPITGQGTWESTLQGRDLNGDGIFDAYYDTTLDITWLADANAAGTTMTWANANAWAAALDVNGVTGWRLPTVAPINGTSFNTTLSTNGTTDRGTATTTTDGSNGGWRDASGDPVSEMGHMFYVTLGNLGVCDPLLAWCTPQSGSGLINTADFLNVQSNLYWSGTELGADDAWDFFFGNGVQDVGGKNLDGLFAWAVRSGDVSAAAVPAPGVLGLFGIGLLGLLGAVRRRR